jgi:hypothetical protein
MNEEKLMEVAKVQEIPAENMPKNGLPDVWKINV